MYSTTSLTDVTVDTCFTASYDLIAENTLRQRDHYSIQLHVRLLVNRHRLIPGAPTSLGRGAGVQRNQISSEDVARTHVNPGSEILAEASM